MRTIEYYGQRLEIDDYQDCHRLANQATFEAGIPVNPTLRRDFDDTPNELRDPKETADWWGKPYIVTQSVDDNVTPWDKQVALFERYGWTLNQTQAEYEQRQADNRQLFLANYPDGIKFTVRCLDGGAHDRSTWIGEFATLAEAVQAAKQRSGQQGRFSI